MSDEELRRLWQKQPMREPAMALPDVISVMKTKTSGLRLTLWARDLRELVVCVIVAAVFGFYYFKFPEPLARLGSLITVAGVIFVAWRLLYVRHKTPPAMPDASLVESLRAELKSVRAQSELLGSVLWWYLLPLAIGSVVFVWGLPTSIVFKIGFAAFTAALDGFIYWLNQQARSTQLLPVEAQLESLLNSAETGAPMDATQLADLRPIAVSMAAAEHARPVEFGVAFSQLAIYAEIGFVGIWFFSMLSLAIDYKQWKTNEQALQTSAQVIPIEEANRYSVEARKVVDLFNAGDYAGLQKLYSPAMAKAFPPKETVDFYTRLAAVGKIETFDGPVSKGHQGWIAFRLHGQHGDLTMSLALDADSKISGIYFERARLPFRNGGSLVRQIFSWQHLVWLVVAFAGGLLFTWLLWNMTKRAVGISAVGIHLNRGMNFMLWEEIKEVRTFRLLNVRSLWLIPETGPKMIMPWTSLERRAELRAAVEKFAPANHPVREYLGLLK
jgi:hypothetical protein